LNAVLSVVSTCKLEQLVKKQSSRLAITQMDTDPENCFIFWSPLKLFFR
jgi:hypothetical protein